MEKIKLFLIINLIFMIFLINFVDGSFIDASFEIDKSGNVEINGESDISLNFDGIVMNRSKISGTTQELTDKIKDIWKFSLSLDTDKTNIKISLPKDSNIFNIETKNEFSISSELDKIILEVKDNKPVNLVFYYSVDLTSSRINTSDFLIYLFISVIIINGIVIYYLYYQLKNQKNAANIKKPKKVDKLKILYNTLNEKEKKVIEAVKSGANYQAKIMEKTEIPKASLSRYINNLIKKGFLIRKGEGKLAEIKLKKR